MKFRKSAIGICMLAAAAVMGACAAKDPGTPPEVLLDGVPVVVGETRPMELSDQGFETNDLGAFITKLPDKSWTSSIFLEKDDISYASITLVNDTREEQAVFSCVIEELGFYALDDTNAGLNISINGVNPIGMTEEELKAAYPELELDDDTGDYRFHYLKNGDYSVRFEYGLGVLTDIDVMHSFSKSYQSK